MSDLDLRPRVVFHTAAGAVVVLVDPTSVNQGTVSLPLLGAVPYDLVYGIPESIMTLHVPYYGDVAIPLNPFGGGPSVVTLPVIGDVPYEIVLGPPELAPGSTWQDTLSAGIGVAGPWVFGLAAVLVALMFRKGKG